MGISTEGRVRSGKDGIGALDPVIRRIRQERIKDND